jgi:hypothetical protein
VSAVGDVKDQAQEATDSDKFDYAIRGGFVVYGVIHLALAWLALQIAFGNQAKKASSTGAIQTLAKQPFGDFLVWVITIGMFVLALWRLLEAWVGHEYAQGGKKWRKKAVSLGKAIIYGSIGVSALGVATGSSSGGGKKGGKSGTDSFTAKVLDLPFGQVLVGAVGLAIIAYGLNMAYRGWTDKFLEHLDAEGKAGDASAFYRWVGKIGHIAKGAAMGAGGARFLYAAFTHNAKKSGGLDQALQKVAAQPYGQIILTAIAAGIACYGLFCFARARHLSR